MNKGAQFFLLAAVILASVLVTLGASVNFARVNKEPDNFYKFSENLKQEGVEVVNYGVFSDNESVSDFIQKAGKYIADMDPDTELFFVYSNGSQLVVENYAREDFSAGVGDLNPVRGCQRELQGSISISVGGYNFGNPSYASVQSYYGRCVESYDIPSGESLKIKISNQTYDFSLGSDKKFIVITKKRLNNETYVNIE